MEPTLNLKKGLPSAIPFLGFVSVPPLLSILRPAQVMFATIWICSVSHVGPMSGVFFSARCGVSMSPATDEQNTHWVHVNEYVCLFMCMRHR